MLSWQLGQRRPGRRSRGRSGLWLSVKTDAPPGATIACVSGRGLRARGARQGAGPASRAAPRPRPARGSRWRCSPRLAAVRSGSGSDGQLDVVATTTQIGDWVREVGGGAVSVDQILQPNTDPHEYEPRPSDVEAAAGAELVFANGDDLDDWIEPGRLRQRQRRQGRRPRRRRCPMRLPGESSGAEASQYDPHWWHDPRNAEAAVREIERRLAAADPSHSAEFRAQRRRLPRPSCAGSTPGSPRCIDAVPAARAQAGHRPRRLRLLRPALRDRRGRRRDPLADDPGPALGQGPQRADRA